MAGRVARVVERRGSHRVLVWKPEGKILLKDLSLDGRVILKQEMGWGHGLD